MKTLLQESVFEALKKAGLTSEKVAQPADIFIEHPQHAQHGDYSTNVAMQLAKELKKNPFEIAQAIAKEILTSEQIEKVEAMRPGFVNFTLSHVWFEQQVKEIAAQYKNDKPPLFHSHRKQHILIEFSSPNVAKPMSVGHLRATIVGDSLRRIYRSLGYYVISDNHLGDWGTQFGILLYAYKRFGDKEKIVRDPIGELYNLYVHFHKLMAENPSLKSKGKEEFVKLEQGDPENRKLWEWFREISLKEFHKTYELLGIDKFDTELGESFYEDMMKHDITTLLNKKVAQQGEDGSIYVDLEPYKLGRFIVVKSDGATTYGTRDISTMRYREENYDFVNNVYVVGLDQVHHFQQLFKVAELMGLKKAGVAIHVPFGMIQDETGHRMSTGKGTVISAQTTVDRAIEKAKEVIEEKSDELKDKEAIAKLIGVGALKYVNLFQHRNTSIAFNWEKVLSFDGNTGPYLQYTHARIQSILRKAGTMPDSADLSLLTDEREMRMFKHLYKLPEAVELAAAEFAPNYIADFCYTLASLVNDFYNNVPVLKGEKAVRDARLVLLAACATTLKQGLYLLGIEAPERM